VSGDSIQIEIRAERPEDANAVRALVTAAFGSDKDTADFVEAVRARARVCLAEVAIVDGAVAGHAQWCEAPFVVDGRPVKGAYLTCLSADPSVQRRGIGSGLVWSGLGRLARRGYAAVSLLGDPDYYARFGFSPALAERIEAPHRARGRGFQALELTAGALEGTVVRGDFPTVIWP
jgi:putative acetyltransferase